MYRNLAELGIFDLSAAGVACLSLVGLILVGRNWPALLWALLLGAVLATIIWMPEHFRESVVAGCAGSMFLILLTQGRAKQRERSLRSAVERLSVTVDEIQNRNILADIRSVSPPPRPTIEEKGEPTSPVHKMPTQVREA
jgi:hypothetical protein